MSRETDIIEAAQAICSERHPSLTRNGTRYCGRCADAANVVVLKLEELGWRGRELINASISDAMDEG